MEIVKRRRHELQLKIRQVSESTGIPRSTLSNIELGRCLPEPVSAKKLRKLLDLPGIPDTSSIVLQKNFRRRPFNRPRPNQVLWMRMEHVYSQHIRRMRLPQAILEWMKECLASDSPLECLADCSLAAVGAAGQFSNPHAWGYRNNCILDYDGLALGERLLPGLRWEVHGDVLMVWPQVTFLTAKGTFRIDYLAYYAGHWFSIEIDGKTHDSVADWDRDKVLKQPSLRITNEDVYKGRFPQILREYLAQLTPLATIE